MDNYEIVMTPRAHFELEEAFVSILELSASIDIAENYVDSIKNAVDKLSSFPKRGRIRERGEFACKTANCGRSFLRIVFDDSSFQTALSGRMKRDFVGIAAGFRRFISADHRWSVETRL